MRYLTSILTLFLLLGCGQDQRLKFQPKTSENQIQQEESYGFQATPGNTYTGFDNDGIKRSCIQIHTAAVTCTQEMTASDVYAQNCTDAGYLAIQCACHDWICVKR